MKFPPDLPPGLVSDDSSHTAAGRWSDASNMRFRLGRPQTIGGWETLIADELGGVCRSIFPWSDNEAQTNIAFGTHATLELFQGGELFDITPTLARPPFMLGTDPLSVTNGQPTVTVTAVAHGLETGDLVAISGAAAVGGITPNIASVAVTVTGVDAFTFAFTSNAASTATGGGSAVKVAPLEALEEGAVDGTGGAGYGTGAYGIGGYGEPSTADAFPRTWSLSAFGENLIANPRGGTIYGWTNDTGVVAAPLLNAPRQVTYTLVTSQDVVMALGCNLEASGVFNHLTIRHSSVRNNTEWNTDSDTTAREYSLTGGGRIVAGRVFGEYVLVWTTDSLFLGTFVGSLEQPYRFDKVPGKGGLLGPNAAVVSGSTAYWVSPDRQFYAYTLGGAITPIACPIRTEFAENLAPSQYDKVVASSIAEYEEVRFDYPDGRDGDDYENSRYLLFKVSGPDAGAWSRGVMARTAMVDAGPTLYPVGVTPEGNIYYHEKGETADGSVLPNYITSADLLMDENRSMMVTLMRPDFQGQRGPVTTTITTRYEPQGDQRVNGPYVASPGQRKVDTRASGRYAQLHHESDYAFRVGNNVYNVEAAGSR